MIKHIQSHWQRLTHSLSHTHTHWHTRDIVKRKKKQLIYSLICYWFFCYFLVRNSANHLFWDLWPFDPSRWPMEKRRGRRRGRGEWRWCAARALIGRACCALSTICGCCRSPAFKKKKQFNQFFFTCFFLNEFNDSFNNWMKLDWINIKYRTNCMFIQTMKE